MLYVDISRYVTLIKFNLNLDLAFWTPALVVIKDTCRIVLLFAWHCKYLTTIIRPIICSCFVCEEIPALAIQILSELKLSDISLKQVSTTRGSRAAYGPWKDNLWPTGDWLNSAWVPEKLSLKISEV
jgi:hypothetical protein